MIFSHTDWNVWNHLILRHYLPPCVDSRGSVVGFPSLKKEEFLAECSVQGHQDSGSCYHNLAPNCQDLATFWWKDICLRVFLESAKDIFANWWKGYMNCYGTGYSNDDVILSHIYVKEKTGKPVGQSSVTVTASKVGLHVEK